MSTQKFFNPGPAGGLIPDVDAARQAVNSLGGYAYQALISTLAWIDLDGESDLVLEIAEDYAVLAKQAIDAVQVKHSRISRPVTLNSDSVRKAIAGFVDLAEKNPDREIRLRFLTTSEIGQEKAMADRPASLPGLEYWRQVAAGAAVEPIREILESDRFPESVREFCKARDDAELRNDLIARIEWDCGTADFDTVRRELDRRLFVLGSEKYGLSSTEARQLADSLVYKVLQQSIADAPEKRVLTRADLYESMDAAAQISLPRPVFNSLVRRASSLSETLSGEAGAEQPFSDSGPSWLLDGGALGTPNRMMAREAVEGVVNDALVDNGTAVIVGPSGSGKSILCRAVVASLADGFSIADFRDTTPDEARERLNALFARVGALPSSTVILEDLNYLDNAKVALGMERVLDALRRRYRKVLITCYLRPSAETLTRLGLVPGCVIGCPYFSEQEVHVLVNIYGGDPEKWGRLAYFSGGSGHPQLTHAFVSEMEARGWPEEEIEHTLVRGLTSADTDAARDAARRNLVFALPKQTRTLLYRLSVVAGQFDRALGVNIGGIKPAVRRSGECLDRLIGPWIEAVGKDEYRVSPLASDFGRKMLEVAEQKRVHKAIAEHISKKSVIHTLDANAIMIHGIAGESTASLAQLAGGLLNVDIDRLETVAEGLPTLRLRSTDQLIYKKDMSVSVMLRMTQFRLAAAHGDSHTVGDIATVLLHEVSRMPDGEPKDFIDHMVLILLLMTKGIANYLDNWVTLLLRFESIVEESSLLQSLLANVESAREASGASHSAILFSIGSAELNSVSRLEMIIDHLDRIGATERRNWLKPIDKSLADYSLLINSPWVAEQSRDGFDASDALSRFRRMSEITGAWGIRPLCLQCWVAQAIMHDEFLDDSEAALAVLDEAVTVMGNDLILSRARAKVHWRRSDHRIALQILRGIADRVGQDIPVERVTALREAAISAANCNDWAQAEEWFLEAQRTAKLMEIDDQQAIVIGLGVDSAVAALEKGDVGRMLERLSEALVALGDINPEATLQNAYCHRIVRHTVLWAQSRILGEDIRIDGEAIVLRPGTCSNPEPLPEIRSLPLGHIDVAPYMLARLEAASRIDVGIRTGLQDRLVQGPIPRMEMWVRLEEMKSHISELDTMGFCSRFWAYVECGTFRLAKASQDEADFDPMMPARGEIPSLKKYGPYGSASERIASDAILAFVIRCALANESIKMSKLENLLDQEFSGTFPGAGVFNPARGKSSNLTELDTTVLSIVHTLLKGDHLAPDAFWLAGLRFLEWVNQSLIGIALIPSLATWQREGWERIIASERFRLITPRRTVPEIRRVLSIDSNDQTFVAKMVLSSASAVGQTLPGEYQNLLVAISKGEEHPSD